jgi:hypothetical protein
MPLASCRKTGLPEIDFEHRSSHDLNRSESETLPRQTHQAESQAGLIPRGSVHAHSVCVMAFVAFLWQIPPIGPVLPTKRYRAYRRAELLRELLLEQNFTEYLTVATYPRVLEREHYCVSVPAGYH